MVSVNDSRQSELGITIKGSSDHAASSPPINNTTNIGRIYDFQVTDCTDIAWKDIFKKTDSRNVNKPTGKVYHSGINRLMSYKATLDQFRSEDEYNAYIESTEALDDRSFNLILPRSEDDEKWGIGSSGQRILPVGPYKNSNDKSYVYAPKLGYRISFDLKTTGVLDTDDDYDNREVRIIPRYYYIGKNGQGFTQNIDLYYKNSNGRYVKLKSYGQLNTSVNSYDTSGGRYTSNGGTEYSIYYKPNDGYRYLREIDLADNISFLSKSLIRLNMSEIVLTEKQMTIDANYQFVQVWFGEFKLPNSTIAVRSEDSINNPLTNGYIGVIFDIYCIDTLSGVKKTLYYAQNDRKAGSLTNTSQWDYEGFMRFNTPGRSVTEDNPLRLQLERGSWVIKDNNTYQKIKGTVLLYDTDQRAANDFN